MNFLLIIFIAIAFLAFFASLWVFVCWVLSHVGGWHTLSKTFRNNKPPTRKCVQNESMRVGLISYSHTMIFCLSTEGLSMSVMILFRVAHPPLLIPWSEFHNPRPSKVLWKKMVTVDVGSPTIRTLMLPEKAYYNKYNGFSLR